MSLFDTLARARTEEDVKDAYIGALGLKGVFKGLVDIQTPEIWFEAKEASTPPLLMFAQLLVYVRAARKRGEAIPGFLCVIDREKAALMATEHALPILEDKSIVWPKSGSAADRALAAQIAPVIETHFVLYRIHATSFPNKIREELKLNRADAGWYQVRRALEAYADTELTDFDPFKTAYVALSEKLRPMVYELGFLPE